MEQEKQGAVKRNPDSWSCKIQKAAEEKDTPSKLRQTDVLQRHAFMLS